MKDGRLQASDLMAGDWVDANGHKEIVEQIERHVLKTNDWAYDWKSSVIKPIPLTKEILEKNGWSQEIYSNESYDNEDIECLSLWVGEDGKNAWWWHAGFELVIPLNYVHEFQHALKLCGITREIII